jgi:hypothetical protein
VYNLDLDLDREQVKQLKQLALDRDLPVRGLVTELVKEAIKVNQNKKVKEDNKEI